MSWQHELGQQIQSRRLALGLSQQQLAQKIGVKRQTINNIEKGSAVAAVNKITEIAKALDQHFVVLGCRIEKEFQDQTVGTLGIVPLQLRLEFDCEYQFGAATLRLTQIGGEDIEMRAVFSSRRSA